MLFSVGPLYAIFDRVIWGTNVIAPSRLCRLSILIRSFRPISLSCRRACRWNVAGQSPMLKILGDSEKVHTFDNAFSKNELTVRWLETLERTCISWLVWGTSFFEFKILLSVLEQVVRSKKTDVNRVSGITRPGVQLQTVLRALSRFIRINERRQPGKRTSFWSDVEGASCQRRGFWHMTE